MMALTMQATLSVIRDIQWCATRKRCITSIPSCTRLIQTRLFRNPRYYELKTTSLGFPLQSFLSAVSHSRYFEYTFVSPASLK